MYFGVAPIAVAPVGAPGLDVAPCRANVALARCATREEAAVLFGDFATANPPWLSRMTQKALQQAGGAISFDYDSQVMVIQYAFSSDWGGNPAKAYIARDVFFKSPQDDPKHTIDLEDAKVMRTARHVEHTRSTVPGYAGSMAVRVEIERAKGRGVIITVGSTERAGHQMHSTLAPQLT